jgi:uncharacterized membrane protein
MNDRHSPWVWAGLTAWLGLAVLIPQARADEGNKRPSPSVSVAPSPAGGPATSETAAQAASEAPPAEEAGAPSETAPPEDVPNPLKPFPWKSILKDHLHNKIIHFPFAFGIAAALFLLAGVRWPAYEPAARVLLWGAALAAIGAYFTGRMQEEAFEDGALEQVLKIHRLLGISTAVSLWVGVLLTSRAGARRVWPFYALWLLGILAATATFGGLLAHGEIS